MPRTYTRDQKDARNAATQRWRARNPGRPRHDKPRTPEQRAAYAAHAREQYAACALENAAQYAERQAELAALKDHPCVDCGQKFPPCAMDFDHVRGEKGYQISASTVRRATIEEELAKCELRCANCHRIRHWGDAT